MQGSERARAAGHEHRSGRAGWAVAAVIVLALALRARLLDAPLERDEGEYAYAGQLILQGVPPYAEVYNMKLPGIYACYALVLAAFGQTASGIHAALALVNALTTLGVFVLARRCAGPWPGAAAAAAFALLSVGQPILGIWANAEHFVLLPAVWGLVALDAALARGSRARLAWAGVLLGAAFVVKQHGGAFVLVGLAWIALDARGRRLRDLTLFGAAAALPFAVTALVLLAVGVFESFWFWTFTYARAYVSQVALADAPGVLLANGRTIALGAPLAWGVAALGLALAVAGRARGPGLHPGLDAGPGRAAGGGARWSARLVALALGSFAAICPGWFFRQHYFLLLLPAASVLFAVGLRALAGGAARLVPGPRARGSGATLACGAALLLVVLGDGLWRGRELFFVWSGVEATRRTYSYNPFAESQEVARIVRQVTGPDERVLVLGSEPQICFHARRRSATGFIYMYSLMEEHEHAAELRRRMMREVDEHAPAVIVYVAVPGSWARRGGDYRAFDAWVQRLTRGTDVVARVPVRLAGLERADEVARWPLEEQPHVLVLRRRE